MVFLGCALTWPSDAEFTDLACSSLVNSRGLETPKGMGQGCAGVGVWVPIFQPLINPYPWECLGGKFWQCLPKKRQSSQTWMGILNH